jgi:radical SAM protein with 4Fe4S-binding SPASM domain
MERMELKLKYKFEEQMNELRLNLPEFAFQKIDQHLIFQEMFHGKELKPFFRPRIYQIETTSRCNLACPFCPRTTDLLKNNVRDLNATMSLKNFTMVLDKMPWVKSLELFHFGEPFMHKDFENYVQACTERGIYTVVASNLLPATPEKIDKVFDAGLNFLVMDVDSLDPEKYASMRVNGRLRILQDRVKYILAHPKRPYTVAQTIKIDGVDEYTEDEFKRWTGGLMPDEIRYKFLDSFRGEVAVEKEMLGPEDICREPFYGFTIHVNGNVVVCDRDWAGENIMGNIFEQTVSEIWYGEKYQKFRKQMLSNEKPDMCKKCPEGKLFNARSQPHIQVNMFKGLEQKM